MKAYTGLLFFCLFQYSTHAQELEPRVYANLPKGTNAIGISYAWTTGNVLTDPSLPSKISKSPIQPLAWDMCTHLHWQKSWQGSR